MGTQVNGFRIIRDIDSFELEHLESERLKLQKNIDDKKNIEDRRKYGQFATPYELAKEMISYGLDLLPLKRISFLEPAVGTGVILSALLQEAKKHNKTIIKATGIEIDKELAQGANNIWRKTNIEIINDDFTSIQPNYKYNFLVTNPPYVRHHYISHDKKGELNNLVKKETNYELSGLSGLYCYFLLLSHKWLAKDAICGWLIPSEFMDVNYGVTIKNYLLNNVHLLRIHRYDPEDLKFKDALVSSCIVWFKNETVNDDYEVELSYCGTLQKPKQLKKIKKSVLLNENKWTRFPEKDVRDTHNNPTLGDYFIIKRGLATGDNSFFILTKEKIDSLKLDMRFFEPVLPSPRHLKSDLIEADEFGNPVIETQYYHLNCNLNETEIRDNYPELWKYLQSGIPQTSNKYLCKGRREWFWQEHRKPTRFLCSYMGRKRCDGSSIRFILNLSEATATNSYLMLYPKGNLKCAIEKQPELIYIVWEKLKSIEADAVDNEGRVYGGGLKKIEPKELAKVSCNGLQELC